MSIVFIVDIIAAIGYTEYILYKVQRPTNSDCSKRVYATLLQQNCNVGREKFPQKSEGVTVARNEPKYKQCRVCKQMKPNTLLYFVDIHHRVIAIDKIDGHRFRTSLNCVICHTLDNGRSAKNREDVRRRLQWEREYWNDKQHDKEQRRLLTHAIYQRYGHPAAYDGTPEDRRAQWLNRRAFNKNIFGGLTGEDIRVQLRQQNGRCWWCGVDCTDGYHVDHRVPLARGGMNTPENVCITCPSCNSKKKAQLPHEWIGRLL